jgi:hypothetical protein
MARDYLLQVFEILTVVLGVLALISSFLYTSRGLITRRTLLVSFFWITSFVLSLWITITMIEPSISIPVLTCLGGGMVLIGISFAIKYSTLPHVQRHSDQLLTKNKKDK